MAEMKVEEDIIPPTATRIFSCDKLIDELKRMSRLLNSPSCPEQPASVVWIELIHVYKDSVNELRRQMIQRYGQKKADHLAYLTTTPFSSDDVVQFGGQGYRIEIQSMEYRDVYLDAILSGFSEQIVYLHISVSDDPDYHIVMDAMINSARLPRLRKFSINSPAIPFESNELTEYVLEHYHCTDPQNNALALGHVIRRLAKLQQLERISLVVGISSRFLEILSHVRAKNVFFFADPCIWKKCLAKLPREQFGLLELSTSLSECQAVLSRHPDDTLDLYFNGPHLIAGDGDKLPDLPVQSLNLRIWKPCPDGMESVIRRYGKTLRSILHSKVEGADSVIETLLREKVLADDVVVNNT